MLVVTQHPMRKQTSASFPNVWWQSGQKLSRAGHRVLKKYHMDRRQIHRGRESHGEKGRLWIIHNAHFDRHVRFAPLLQSRWANGTARVGIPLCPLPHGRRNRLSGVSQCVLVVTQADPSESGSRWSSATVVVFL